MDEEYTDVINWCKWKYSINNKSRSELIKLLSKKGIDDPYMRSIISKQTSESSPTLHSFINFLNIFKRNFEQIKKEDLIAKIQSNIHIELKNLKELELEKDKDKSYDYQRIHNNLIIIKDKIKELINRCEIINGNLVINNNFYHIFNFIIIAIEYLDTGATFLPGKQKYDEKYPLPQIFKINMSSMTAEGKHKKRTYKKRTHKKRIHKKRKHKKRKHKKNTQKKKIQKKR